MTTLPCYKVSIATCHVQIDILGGVTSRSSIELMERTVGFTHCEDYYHILAADHPLKLCGVVKIAPITDGGINDDQTTPLGGRERVEVRR